MNIFKEYINDFLSLIFPELCQACGNNLFKGETVICTFCQQHLPYTNFHLDKANPVAKQFWGKIKIEAACACFNFRKGGKVQNLLHQLKYKKQQEVGVKLGRIYGYQLRYAEPYDSVDIIIPVPLHPTKLKTRGYNQSECFAKGLAESMKIPINSNSLIKTTSNETQTKKNRFQRHENVESIYQIRDIDELSGKHILLVDDVITTGATIEACAESLLKIENVSVSVAAIAYAK
ncbi:ComF family protein [Solitalea canadensis]|nr:phosphoribosyltransferase family protein [Solitalea canadensis]